MFTGLIQKTGRIEELQHSDSGGSIRLVSEPWNIPVELGESIAVQGVCLTVAKTDENGLMFDVLAETFQRTSLGSMQVGSHLNLERALRAGDALGGHIVNGHVDGVGRIKSIAARGRDKLVEIAADESIIQDIVYKGSIAVDGISLTVSGLKTKSFHVDIIPHTWEMTSLCEKNIDDMVNLETDILSKYVRRVLEEGHDNPFAVTWEDLREMGWSG